MGSGGVTLTHERPRQLLPRRCNCSSLETGSVEYERVKGSTTTKVSGPLKGFEGNDFEVGFGPFSTTFVVSEPPHREGDGWRMTVERRRVDSNIITANPEIRAGAPSATDESAIAAP